jgi:AcrR family transcriptional regulator
MVEVMAAAGVPLAGIAAAVTSGGISLGTLRRHFANELKHGRAKAHGAVARSLFQQACKGNVAACRLWLERHGPTAGAGANNKDDIAQVLDRLVAGSRQRLERQLARLAAAGEAGKVSS